METSSTIKITIETENQRTQHELPWDADMELLIENFYATCIGLTYNPITVLQAMQTFAEDNLSAIVSISQPVADSDN